MMNYLFPIFNNWIPNDYNLPPTIYSILNSYVNFGKEKTEQKKIKELAKYGRLIIFDFDYPLYDENKKEEFEIMILNHYMIRRIGYDTMTAFKMALNVKLNEIMPTYNKLFNAMKDWEIFIDGEVTTRLQKNINVLSNTTTSTNISDRRYSDTPQTQLDDVQNGTYVSQYNYDSDNGRAISNTNDNGTINETINRTPADKMKNYIDFINEKENVYSLIFKELDTLFYQII